MPFCPQMLSANGSAKKIHFFELADRSKIEQFWKDPFHRSHNTLWERSGRGRSRSSKKKSGTCLLPEIRFQNKFWKQDQVQSSKLICKSFFEFLQEKLL